jgi:hypothetical protein
VAVDHPVGVPLGRLLGLPVSQARHHVMLQGAQRQKIRRKKALQWEQCGTALPNFSDKKTLMIRCFLNLKSLNF